MNEDGKDRMSIENSIQQSTEVHGPGLNSIYPVQYTPENAQNVAGLLNKIVAFEIGQGVRSDVHDPKNADALDALQRGFMVASQQKFPTPISMSEAHLADVEDRFEKYSKAKGLSEEERAVAQQALLTMEVSLRNVRTSSPSVKKTPGQIGIGPNSLPPESGRKTAEKGSNDRLG